MARISFLEGGNTSGHKRLRVAPHVGVEARGQERRGCRENGVTVLVKARELGGKLEGLVPFARTHQGGKLVNLFGRRVHAPTLKG